MQPTPTLRELLNNGVHFGHVTARWNPKMKPYIFASRDKVHLINLEQTKEKLEEALQFINTTVQHGGNLLFVGTKMHAKDIVKSAAENCGMPHLTERWLGGTLTNFNVVRNNVKTLEQIEADETAGNFEHLTKNERLKIEEKKRKLNLVLNGIRNLVKLPSALIVVDSNHEQIAVNEARALNIPVVAIVDTNADPSQIDYPIPANDDASKSLNLLLNLISSSIKEASASRPAETVEKISAEKEAGEEQA